MRIRPSPRTKSARSGVTLVELMVVMALLAVALSAMADTVISITRLGPVNQETGRALEAARATLETVRAAPFEEIWRRYNADPADDPGGPGTAPGKHFAAPLLGVRPGDADGFVGEVRLPEIGGALREDLGDPVFGMPRDLNGDGAIDALDHAGDYDVLPVCIVVEWTGPSGERSLVLPTQLVRP